MAGCEVKKKKREETKKGTAIYWAPAVLQVFWPKG